MRGRAARAPGQAVVNTRPFRPSNGTQGASFIGHFCANCERDRNEDCPILAATFALDVDDPDYPKEWVEHEENGKVEAECTAFVEKGEPLPTPRCEQTDDMFGGARS